MIPPSPLIARVATYYEGKLTAHGPTPAGVDWNSEASQTLRFRHLLRIIDRDEPPDTINDFGCGYGALADYLAATHPGWAYRGFDASPRMIETAQRVHAGNADRFFTDDRASLAKARYTVASGIFNVKLDFPDEEWTQYMVATLDALAALSSGGFAFNVLTAYADPAHRRSDLYYADPHALFAHCRSQYSPRIALLHDYPLFEFTILVRF